MDLDDLDDLDDMDDLDMNIVAHNGKDEVEGKTPPSHYVSPSRSHSRLTRLESNRVSTFFFFVFCFCIFCNPVDINLDSLFTRSFLVPQIWLDTCQ